MMSVNLCSAVVYPQVMWINAGKQFPQACATDIFKTHKYATAILQRVF